MQQLILGISYAIQWMMEPYLVWHLFLVIHLHKFNICGLSLQNKQQSYFSGTKFPTFGKCGVEKWQSTGLIILRYEIQIPPRE